MAQKVRDGAGPSLLCWALVHKLGGTIKMRNVVFTMNMQNHEPITKSFFSSHSKT
jgi:hypothetical protein